MGKTFKWLLSNDVGYAAMVLAVHQREREGGDTTQSAVMGNKDALLQYAGLFPDVLAAIIERRVREGTSTPTQEDQVLVGLGDFASMSFKDIYEATDRSRKGYGALNRLLLVLLDLTSNVQGSDTLSLFKSRLKTHLFSQAFTQRVP